MNKRQLSTMKPASYRAKSTKTSSSTKASLSSEKSQSAKRAATASSSSLLVNMINSDTGLHVRNLHRGRYPFQELVRTLPELQSHVIRNPKGEMSINFSDPVAVKLLNKALLAHYYGVKHWDIPQGYLCPPIPGRADYIHRLAEMLKQDHPTLDQRKVRALDIGVGANAIYPIVAATTYGWHCVGSDIDPVSVQNAEQIAQRNSVLTGRIECRHQPQSRFIFQGIIQPNEYYDVTTCNPPFHKSLAEAEQGTQRKLRNLTQNRTKRSASTAMAKKGVQPQPMQRDTKAVLNFGGQKAELWCPGGEAAFIKNMAFESRDFAHQVLWFTSLISKKENVRWMRKQLEKAGAVEARVYEMSQGQKVSRFIAWTFQTPEQRLKWLSVKSR